MVQELARKTAKKMENQMKHQKNTHSRKIIACMLCIVMAATLLSVTAFAAGSCSYRFSNGVVCGKDTTRKTISTSATQHGVHYYYSESLGGNARCDYSYYTVTEADVCAYGHNTNKTTTRHEFGHGCMNPGR